MIRLSKLQKQILLTLLESTNGSYKKSVWVNKNNEGAKNALLKTGYVFANHGQDPKTGQETDEDRYEIKLPERRLLRRYLMAKIYHWEKFNIYKETATWCGSPMFGCKRGYWYKGFPEDYKKKQAAFTRSLRELKVNGLVELLDCYEEGVAIFNPRLAKKLNIEAIDIEKQKAEGLKKYRADYEKEKASGSSNPNLESFDSWMDEKITQMIFGCPVKETTRRHIFESNYCRRNARNAKFVRLTQEGVKKASSLSVNSFATIKELTDREGGRYEPS